MSQKAIHFENVEQTVTDEDGNTTTVVHENVRGVFVRHGTEIEFVQIIPLYNGTSYVICEEITANSENADQIVTDQSIRLSDEVVIEGTDLYDGKVIP